MHFYFSKGFGSLGIFILSPGNHSVTFSKFGDNKGADKPCAQSGQHFCC